MGLIHIYCGDGKGKTTACTGLAVRSYGAGKRVLFTQFFKSGFSSEIKVLKTLKGLEFLSCEQTFGRFTKMTDEQKILSKQYHSALLNEIISRQNDFDIIILDEIISAYNYNMVDHQTFKKFLLTKPDTLEIVMSGRNPHNDLITLANYVSHIQKIKHPFDKGVKARKGIEF